MVGCWLSPGIDVGRFSDFPGVDVGFLRGSILVDVVFPGGLFWLSPEVALVDAGFPRGSIWQYFCISLVGVDVGRFGALPSIVKGVSLRC